MGAGAAGSEASFAVEKEALGVDSDIASCGGMYVLSTVLLRSVRRPRTVPALRAVVGGACYGWLVNKSLHSLFLHLPAYSQQ